MFDKAILLQSPSRTDTHAQMLPKLFGLSLSLLDHLNDFAIVHLNLSKQIGNPR